MNFDSSNYFAYKKNKLQKSIEKPEKKFSRFRFLMQLFFITFILMFIIIVISIMKYSAKVDIEYTKGDLSLHNDSTKASISGYSSSPEEEQRKIDKRLILIQQEENAPSEARIVQKAKDNSEVISQEHIKKEPKKVTEVTKNIKEVSLSKEQKNDDLLDIQKNNIIIMSKVLIGRYSTFEEAVKMQDSLRANYPKLSPFVKKFGEVFSVQMGSYQDFQMAKNQAQTLKAKGYEVWIYQQ